MEIPPEDLVERAARGEPEALDALIVAHLPELHGFVGRRLGGGRPLTCTPTAKAAQDARSGRSVVHGPG